MIAEKLMARLGEKRTFSVGISGDDLKRLSLTPDLKADIISAINSHDPKDTRLGLFFAECLVNDGIDDAFKNALIDASISHLDTNEWGIKPGCLSLLFLLGQKRSDYRSWMIDALGDKDPLVRGVALAAYFSYAKPKEFEPLEQFENDDYLTEIGMGSHLIYAHRNQALETIEKAINRTFQKSEKTEVLKDGVMAFCWNWEPFHKWKRQWWRKIL